MAVALANWLWQSGSGAFICFYLHYSLFDLICVLN
jgi:hypothetical protein